MGHDQIVQEWGVLFPYFVLFVYYPLFYRIVNGSADDAVLTELFGLGHAHSPRSQALREQASLLEGLLIQGKATTKQKAELERLESQLPATMSDGVERALTQLTAKLDAVKGTGT